MPRFPSAKYRDAVRVAKKLGFSFYRMGKGDHEVWGRPSDGRVAVISHTAGDIKRKTLKSILEAFQISPEEFLKLKKGKR